MSLANTHAKLSAQQDFRIVYMGGSITYAGHYPGAENRSPGYRNHITDWLRKKYPQANIIDRHAAVSGTGSELGVLRMEKDVLPYRPDLVFVEFAVNDGGTHPTRIRECMEGIVRQLWTRDPMTDIVFLFTMNKGMFYAYAKETKPNSVIAHEAVAAHYGIPTVNMGIGFYYANQAGTLDWNEFFNDESHPNAAGHKWYGDVAAQILEPLLCGTPQPHDMPPALTGRPWIETRMTYVKDIPHEGWEEKEIEYWGYSLTMVESDKPGKEISFGFNGNVISVYWHLAMDTGDVKYSIDDGPWKRSPTWDGWVLQAPERINYKLWADDLPQGEHTVRVRIADRSVWKQSEGNWIRLIAFLTA